MMGISAVISAYNEEVKLERCLRSLGFTNEIIVVDHFSTDKTLEIAKKYTQKIFQEVNNPQKIDIQKNYGFSQVSYNWILSIDADEEVSEELAKEIKEVIKDSEENAYYIPRKNIIFGKWIEHTGWYPDHQLRLFRKGKGEFTKKHVHEQLEVRGEKGYLKNHILHYNYDSISGFLNKTIVYAQNEAEEKLDKGYIFSKWDSIRFPVDEFMSRFFTREGYKDGLHGLILSILMAFYHFIVFALIWEKKRFTDYNSANFLAETEEEIKKVNKEISFWFRNEKIKSANSPVEKILHRIHK